MTGLYRRLGRFAHRHARGVILVYLAVSLLLLWLGSSIRFETSLVELMPAGTPAVDDFKDYLQADESLDRFFVSISPGPDRRDDGSGDDERILLLADAAEELGRELVSTGLVRSARHGVELEELIRAVEGAMDHLPVLVPAADLERLAGRLRPGAIEEQLLATRSKLASSPPGDPFKRLAAIDPLGLSRFVPRPASSFMGVEPDPSSGLFLSRDGRHLLLVLEAAKPPTEIAFSRRLMDAVTTAEESLRESSEQYAGLRFEHAGGHLFALEDERRTRHDGWATSAFSLGAILAIYFFVIGRPALWLAIMVPLSMTTVWTLGLASIYPGRLNMITVAFAAILLGIGDDAMIHMYLREREERRKGLPPGESVVEAVAGTGRAMTLATLTSAAAFLSLSLVEFKGLSELGVIAALGMLNLLAGVLVFFPAALSFLAVREPSEGPPLRLPLQGVLAVIRWTRRRRVWVLASAGLLTALMAWQAAQVSVSADLRSIRGEDPAASAMATVLAPFGESASAEMMVVIHGPRQAGPADLERGIGSASAMAGLCEELRAGGRIRGCSHPPLLPPARAVQKERFDRLRLLLPPGARESFTRAADAAGMNPVYFNRFLASLDRYTSFDQVELDAGPGSFGALGLPQTRVFFDKGEDAGTLASEIRSRLPASPVRIASVSLVSTELGRTLASDYRRAGYLVLGAIAVLALVAFRRAGSFLYTLTPVALGAIWMLGSARLAGLELNLMALMGMPVIFGLGVDYGVYIIDRWQQEEGDLQAAMAGVGPAVLVTGLTTLAGFAALLAAQLAGLRSLGFVVVTGAGFTLAAAMIVLPALLPSRESRPE